MTCKCLDKINATVTIKNRTLDFDYGTYEITKCGKCTLGSLWLGDECGVMGIEQVERKDA